MEERTDGQLIAAYLEGDEASLALLFKKHVRSLYAFISRLVGPEEADDAVQEAFIRAWKHLKRFDPEKNFKPWLFRIARNAPLDLLKKKKPAAFSELSRSESEIPIEETIEDPSPLPSELLEREDAAERLKATLAGLSPKQRIVIELR